MDAILFVRSISGNQAKVILALLFQRGGMTVEELEQRTGLERRTIYRACDELARPPFAMLVKQTGSHNRATWLPSAALLPVLRDEYFPDVRQSDNYIEANGSQLYLTRTTDPENGAKTAPVVRNADNWPGSIRLIDEPLSSCSNEPGFPTLEKILQSLSILRGMKVQNKYRPDIPWESLGTDGLERTPAKLALAWVVKAYSDRERLSNPVGMVLTRLKSFASRSLPENWQERLPSEYLQAIGVASLPIPDAPDTTTKSPADDRPESFRQYEQNIGPLTPLLANAILDAENNYPEAWIPDAISIAVAQNKRSWAYIEGVLKKWNEFGRGYDPQKAKANHADNGKTHRPKPAHVPARRTQEIGNPAEPDPADIAIAQQLLGLPSMPG